MNDAFHGFAPHRIQVDDGVSLHALVGGSGDPVALLHGFPQTHLMWRHVAAELATDHTVICPDLRGYGASDKPSSCDEAVYSKRTMANDVVALAPALGHERFALAGHDRGALVAFRAGLDHRTRSPTQLSMPVTVLQQDWGSALGYDAAATWRRWASDLDHVTVTSGHFMAEADPDTVTAALRSLLER